MNAGPIYLITWVCLLIGSSCRMLEEVESESPHEWLMITAESRITETIPNRLEITATIRNLHPRKDIEIEQNCIPVLARLYSKEGFENDPVWREEDNVLISCFRSSLPPGETLERKVSLRVAKIISDGITEGIYLSAASLYLNGAFTPDIPAGVVEMKAPSEPVPNRQTLDGIAYQAEIHKLHDPGPVYRIDVTMTNTRSETIRSNQSAETGLCPIYIWGYHTEEKRNTYYAQRFPDWVPWEIRHERRCLLEIDVFELQPGASKTFPAYFLPPRGTSIPLPQYMLVRFRLTLDTDEEHEIFLSSGVAE